MRPFLEAIWHSDRRVIALCGAYTASAGVVLLVLGRRWPLALVSLPLLVIWASFGALSYIAARQRSRPDASHTFDRRRIAGAVTVLLLAAPVHATFQTVKQAIGHVIGFHADPLLHRIDVVLHGGMPPWRRLQPLLEHGLVIRGLDALYLTWFAVLFGFVGWLAWTPRRSLRERALLAFVLLWIGAGSLSAALAPSAGPCYYQEVYGDAAAYGPLLARLDAIGATGAPLVARTSQAGLWALHSADQWAPFGGVSAMPSLHVAAAVLFALVAWQMSAGLGVVASLYAIGVQLGSVLLAWHYAVDGYVGAVAAVIAWHAAKHMESAPPAGPTAAGDGWRRGR